MIRSSKHRQRGRLLFECLEDRCLPAGTVPAGIYVEDFTDDLDPSRAGFDRSMAFQHTFEDNGQIHVITDPLDVSGPGRNYEITRFVPPDDDLLIYRGVDRITFPNLRPDVHVAFARVDLTGVLADAAVEFVGQNGAVTNTFQFGDVNRSAAVGEEHVLPSGARLGPIQQVILHGHETAFASVRLLVIPDQAPQILDDFVRTPIGRGITIDVLANDVDPEGQAMLVQSFTLPSHGSVQKVGNQVRYVPRRGYHGLDAFSYVAVDPDGNTATAMVHVSINSPPVVENPQIFLAHGTPGPITGQLHPTDPDGDTVGGFEVVTQPAHGTVTLRQDGTFVYEPIPVDDYDRFTGRILFNVATVRGPDHFIYRVHDGFDASEGRVEFVVPNAFIPRRPNGFFPPEEFAVPGTPVDGPARAISWAAPGVLFDDYDAGDLTATRPVVDPLAAVLVESPRHGFFVLNADGSFIYAPVPGFLGVDDFRYRYTVDHLAADSSHPLVLSENPSDNDTDLVAGTSAYVVRNDDVANAIVLPDGTMEFRLTDEFGGEGMHTFTYAYRTRSNLLSNFAKIIVYLVTPDSDGDGVHDGDERDSFDSLDPRRATLPLGNEETLSLSTSSGDLSNVRHLPNPHPADSPVGVVFPVGFVGFQVAVQPGGAATVTLSLPPGFDVNGYYKYGSEPDDPATTADETNPHWYNFFYDPVTRTGATFGQSPIGGALITLHFVDGQRGDDDGVANGVISDPGGPARAPAPVTVRAVRVDPRSPRAKTRSLTLTFSDVVTLDRGAFELRRADGGRLPVRVASVVVGDHVETTLTFRASKVAQNGLHDRGYDLVIRARQVHGQGGFVLDGNGDGRQGDNAKLRFDTRKRATMGVTQLETADADALWAILGTNR